MKLTWFGGSAFRIHLGGQVVVIEPNDAPKKVEQSELTGGADRIVSFSDSLPTANAETWRPRRPQRLLDAGDALRPVDVCSLGDNAIVLDADDEQPLLVIAGDSRRPGRWASSAVMVLAGPDLATRATALLQSAPRLIALAGTETEIDAAFVALRPHLDNTGLIALEPGLAVEV